MDAVSDADAEAISRLDEENLPVDGKPTAAVQGAADAALKVWARWRDQLEQLLCRCPVGLLEGISWRDYRLDEFIEDHGPVQFATGDDGVCDVDKLHVALAAERVEREGDFWAIRNRGLCTRAAIDQARTRLAKMFNCRRKGSTQFSATAEPRAVVTRRLADDGFFSAGQPEANANATPSLCVAPTKVWLSGQVEP